MPGTASSINPKSRAGLISQGNSRTGGNSKLLYQPEAAGAQGVGPGNKPRATSAYGNASRRNLPNTQQNYIVQNMGTH